MNKIMCDACGKEITRAQQRVEVHITDNRASKWGYDYMKDYHRKCLPEELKEKK